jgi:hypothetical protein
MIFVLTMSSRKYGFEIPSCFSFQTDNADEVFEIEERLREVEKESQGTVMVQRLYDPPRMLSIGLFADTSDELIRSVRTLLEEYKIPIDMSESNRLRYIAEKPARCCDIAKLLEAYLLSEQITEEEALGWITSRTKEKNVPEDR